MLVRMLVGLSGSEYSLGPGDQRDFPQAEALRLIAAGYAVPAAEQKMERATVQPAPEKRGRRGRNVVRANDNSSAGE